jgi:CubicO group peptidase (beta-lactamase class C family)
MEADTIFRVYSMSKPITGVATMIAYEHGYFLLDDPVSKYLPTLADMRVRVVDKDGNVTVVAAERDITILDLLRHTSGFTYSFMAPQEIHDAYIAQGITPGIRGVSSVAGLGETGADKRADLADMVVRLGDIPLVAQPGTEFNYGISMDVLGRLIEVVAGQPYPVFLEENLFAPLEMADTAFYVPAEKVDRFAASYGMTEKEGLKLLDAPATSAYREPPAMPGGGGGLVSTVHDYMRFALMLANNGELDGTRILSRKTVDLMMSNHMPASEFGDRPLGVLGDRLFANGGRGVGFGFTGSVIVDPAATTLPGSAGTFSWGGAASTFFWVDREEDLVGLFMTQLIPSGSYPLRPELLLMTYQSIAD